MPSCGSAAAALALFGVGSFYYAALSIAHCIRRVAHARTPHQRILPLWACTHGLLHVVTFFAGLLPCLLPRYLRPTTTHASSAITGIPAVYATPDARHCSALPSMFYAITVVALFLVGWFRRCVSGICHRATFCVA